jgi:hypothetical protein
MSQRRTNPPGIDVPADHGPLNFSSPPNGKISGTADASEPILAMSYQINGNAPVTISDYNTGTGVWYAFLDTEDCPTVGSWYMLTVYAYYADGGNCKQRSFTRGD